MALLILGACDREPVPGDGSDGWTSGADRPTLEVAAVDLDGAPVTGAWAVLHPGGRDAETAADGVATFSMLAAGTYDLAVSAPGFEMESTGVTLEADDLSVDVVLEPLVRLTGAEGTVLSVLGDPVRGAVVDLGGATTTSDPDGYWELEVEAGTMAFSVTPSYGGTTLPWSSPAVEIEHGGQTVLDVTLPAAPFESSPIYSHSCGGCHPDVDAEYEEHPHAAGRWSTRGVEISPGELAGLPEAVTAGQTVPLDDGGQVILSRVSSDQWFAEVEDASGETTGAMTVAEVYGGHIAGAAFAVQAGDTWAVLPVAWAFAGGGASGEQAEAGFVEAWSEGWFDAGGNLDLDASGAPGPEASFDLRCAGCHATGPVLDEVGGQFEMSATERQVGCEACHGPGMDHMTESDREEHILDPAFLPAWQQVELCARCHERMDDDDHPFSSTPGWVVDGNGDGLLPWESPADHATADHVPWLEVSASAVPFDKVGDLRLSPHHSGPGGYLGLCTDCHDPHGSGFRSSLHADPSDNALCTGCHGSTFPDEAAEADHAAHTNFDQDDWAPGRCTGCHLPRTATVIRPDAVSGAGELHSHTLEVWSPAAAVAEFDAAGTDTLPLGSVPASSCLDCHRQAKALADEEGGVFAGPPPGDPRSRSTYESLGSTFDALFGGAR